MWGLQHSLYFARTRGYSEDVPGFWRRTQARLSLAPSPRGTSGGPEASPLRWGVAERPRPASSCA